MSELYYESESKKNDDGNELMHYGVLGMKWGQHKARVYESKAKDARDYAKELRTSAKVYASSAKNC